MAVRRLRTKAGISQEAFAAKSGIDRSYYGKIERGDINVSLDNIERLAVALGLKPGQLVTEADAESAAESS
ncbi:MAG: helix-turn-helix transcriptional regulator [Gemmatimonadales bacterium]|nr:helix-turn-helix transcriptional regulator [Gemmatimonadales bacterium]